MKGMLSGAARGVGLAAVLGGLAFWGVSNLAKPTSLFWEGPDARGPILVNTFDLDERLNAALKDLGGAAEAKREAGRKLGKTANLSFYGDAVMTEAGKGHYSAYVLLAKDPNTKTAKPEELNDIAFVEGYLQALQPQLSSGPVTVRPYSPVCNGGCKVSLTWNVLQPD